jgi:hypothetical protein
MPRLQGQKAACAPAGGHAQQQQQQQQQQAAAAVAAEETGGSPQGEDMPQWKGACQRRAEAEQDAVTSNPHTRCRLNLNETTQHQQPGLNTAGSETG